MTSPTLFESSKPLNPIEKRLAEGMSPLAAFLTESTCGEACWHAREDVCRCSCGGKNHGCLRSEDGERPARTAKIDGYRYELKAVGTGLYDEAKRINDSVGYKEIHRITPTLVYHYHWHETDKGAPARLKPATKDQRAKWPELSAYRDMKPWEYCYLLWVRCEMPQGVRDGE